MSRPVPRETALPGLEPEPWQALRAYHSILASEGVERGLVGPREAERLWSRHILNCAAVALDRRRLVPTGASVLDVGSGAGLPGLVWALVRPDISVVLLDSLLRRTTFLTEALGPLGLSGRVEVVRGRAESLAGVRAAQVVTARAVAPLPRLVPWLAPLVRHGGAILAIKGESAQTEVEQAARIAFATGLEPAEILRCGEGNVDPPTVVVRYRRRTRD